MKAPTERQRQWEKAIALFAKPFATASVPYFDVTQMDEATKWARKKTQIFDVVPLPSIVFPRTSDLTSRVPMNIIKRGRPCCED